MQVQNPTSSPLLLLKLAKTLKPYAPQDLPKIGELFRRFPSNMPTARILDEAEKMQEFTGEQGISIAQLGPIIRRSHTREDSAAIMEWAENRVGDQRGRSSRSGTSSVLGKTCSWCFERVEDKIVAEWEWTKLTESLNGVGPMTAIFVILGWTVPLPVFYIVGLRGIQEWARDASSGKGSCPPGVWIYTVAAFILVGANWFFCTDIVFGMGGNTISFFSDPNWYGDYRIGNGWIVISIQFCFSFTLAIWGSVAMSQVDDSHIAAMNCSNEYLADRWNCEPDETQIFVDCKDLPLFTFTQVVTYFYFAVLMLLCCASAPPCSGRDDRRGRRVAHQVDRRHR